jgi:hypothetical protein
MAVVSHPSKLGPRAFCSRWTVEAVREAFDNVLTDHLLRSEN